MQRYLWIAALSVTAGGCAFDVSGFAGTSDSIADAGLADPDAGSNRPDASPHDADAAPVPAAEMVGVPGSPFQMGCPIFEQLRCRGDEQPARMVTLDSFSIDRTEVTRAHYRACVDAGACTAPHCEWNPDAQPQLPVVCVTWNEARDYCAWVGSRLPSEAEWEKTARGRTGSWYPWGEAEPTCDRAQFASCGDGLRAVGTLPAGVSPFGAADMAGNAFEWVSDWYQPDYYSGAPSANPAGPPSGVQRVARGGSFRFDETYMRTSLRSHDAPELWFDDLGFRCARSAP